jgi:hypothetical protein
VSLLFLLLLYWGYTVAFTKVLTLYHSWIILLYPSSPLSWNSFNRCHFSIHIHVYTVFAQYLPFYTFSSCLPPSHWYQFPREDLFCLPALNFCKKNDFILPPSFIVREAIKVTCKSVPSFPWLWLWKIQWRWWNQQMKVDWSLLTHYLVRSYSGEIWDTGLTSSFCVSKKY